MLYGALSRARIQQLLLGPFAFQTAQPASERWHPLKRHGRRLAHKLASVVVGGIELDKLAV